MSSSWKPTLLLHRVSHQIPSFSLNVRLMSNTHINKRMLLKLHPLIYLKPLPVWLFQNQVATESVLRVSSSAPQLNFQSQIHNLVDLEDPILISDDAEEEDLVREGGVEVMVISVSNMLLYPLPEVQSCAYAPQQQFVS